MENNVKQPHLYHIKCYLMITVQKSLSVKNRTVIFAVKKVRIL